jgi:hypothetical protein
MDAVERQVQACNERNLDEFVDSYTEAVVIENGEGEVLMSGRDEMRDRYGPLFAGSPRLHGEIVTRIRVGSYVVDEERITGGPAGDVHAVAIYRIDGDGLIDRVWFLR